MLLEEMQRLFFISSVARNWPPSSRTSTTTCTTHCSLEMRRVPGSIVVSQIEGSRERVLQSLIRASRLPGRAAAGVVLAEGR